MKLAGRSDVVLSSLLLGLVLLDNFPRTESAEKVYSCPNDCNEQGRCLADLKCQCFKGFSGPDCRQRACPYGTAWVDYATATDTAHAPAECSNMGLCDRANGRCRCRPGFEGTACERLSCPADCSKRGQCLSMREAALLQFGPVLNRSVAYSLWDADMVHGCVCDPGFYGHDCSQRYCPKGDDPLTTGQANEVHTLSCTCTATCAGTFTLSFRGRTTAPIPHDAGHALVKQKLEALDTVASVAVSFSAGVAVCAATAVATTIEFTGNFGDLPAMTVASSLTGGVTPVLTLVTVQTISCACGTCVGSLAFTYDGETTAELAPAANAAAITAALQALSGISAVTVTFSTGAQMCDTAAVTTSITFAGAAGNVPKMGYISSLSGSAPAPTLAMASADGTKEDLECSGRGTCDHNTGVCRCFGYNTAEANVGWVNYSSSDGANAQGGRGDCGWAYRTPTHCPVKLLTVGATTSNVTCSSHGTCAGSPSWKCDCYDGWAGGVCDERSCPTGVAWFDEATAADTAHALAPCSNMGRCDTHTGLCVCAAGFMGKACETMECYGDVGKGQCNGFGVCRSMSELAAAATSGGDATALTYGATPGKVATWDAHMVRGCTCDRGYRREPDGDIAWPSYYCSLRELALRHAGMPPPSRSLPPPPGASFCYCPQCSG
jgi:hypothetical protein